MKIFDIFRKLIKRKDSGEIGSDIDIGQTESFPSDLERFKIKQGPVTAPEPVMRPQFIPPEPKLAEVVQEPKLEMPPRPGLPEVGPLPPKPEIIEEVKKEAPESEKLDIILQRLETIDTRLKLIEERTRK